MRQLTKCQDGLIANELERALDAAGIPARITTEAENTYLNMFCFVVWVADDADPQAIGAVFQAVQNRRAAQSNRPATRVSPSEEMVHCLACHYDLRGQTGDGLCPECGHPYRLIVHTSCPNCRADVPGDFDTCWNCGAEIPAPK